MARQWILASQEGFEKSLQYQENVKIPSADELGPHDVLVQIHAASLNYREIVIADPNGMNGPITPPVVPGCDGAGVVTAVGGSVTELRPGDRVITWPGPHVAGDDTYASMADVPAVMGQGADGTLRSWAVFPERGLVRAPASLTDLEAAALPCTFTTAWNALFGVPGNVAGPGSWVLVQGTGGVSVATLQLAVAAGASVVATTSSGQKAARLRALGAKGTVNYRENSDGWGAEARALTPGGKGFDIVVDVGGDETLPQSLAAVRTDGVVQLTGFVGDKRAAPVPLLAAFMAVASVRGLLLGTRNQLKEAVRFVDEKGIRPAVDDVVFELAEAKEAYRRLNEKKHFAKVVIRVDHKE